MSSLDAAFSFTHMYDMTLTVSKNLPRDSSYERMNEDDFTHLDLDMSSHRIILLYKYTIVPKQRLMQNKHKTERSLPKTQIPSRVLS